MSGPVIKVGKFRVQIRAIANNQAAKIRAPLGAPAVADNTAPSVPQNLIVTAHTSVTVSLAWDASTDAESGVKEYVVLRGGTQIAVVSAPSTSYTDTGLTVSTSYTYTVRARDNAGNTSVDSSSVSQTTDAAPGDTTPPTAPADLVVTQHTATTLSLAWTGSTDAAQADSPMLRAEVNPANLAGLTANQQADILRELRMDASRKLRPANPAHWTVGALEVYPGADAGGWTPTAANGWGNEVGGVDAVFLRTRYVAPITADGGTLPVGWSRATGSGDGSSMSTPWTLLQAKRSYIAGDDIIVCTGPSVPVYHAFIAGDGTAYGSPAVGSDTPVNFDRGNTIATAATFGTLANPVRFRASDPLYRATVKWASTVRSDVCIKITQSYVILDGIEPYGNTDNSPSFPGSVGIQQTGTLSDGSPISHVVITNCRPHHLREGGIALNQCIDVRIDTVHPWLCGTGSTSHPSGISWNAQGVTLDASSYDGFRVYIVNCMPAGSADDSPSTKTDGNGIIIDNGDVGTDIPSPNTLIANCIPYWNGNRGLHVYKSDNVTVVNCTPHTNGLQTNASEPSTGSTGECSQNGGEAQWANIAVNPWQGAGAFGSKPFHAIGTTPDVTTRNDYYVSGRHDDNTGFTATELHSTASLVLTNAPYPTNSGTAEHLNAPDPATVVERFRPVSGIKQYLVFRNGVQVGTTVVPAFTDTGLASNTSFVYKIRAVDLAGNVSVDSAPATGTTDPAPSSVSTPVAYGPLTPPAPPTTLAGGTYVVKSDGKIYDATGVTLVDFTNKRVLANTTIKSDVAGTRRALNLGLLDGAQFANGVVFDEVNGSGAMNFETDSAAGQWAIRLQGIAGTWKHLRTIKSAQNSIWLGKSSTGLFPGSNAASWDTNAPDLVLENFTCHANAGGQGTSLTVTAGRNIRIGGMDTGTQSTPQGIAGWPTLAGIVFDAATKLDIQDVYIDSASDGTPSMLASSTGTYTFLYGTLKRSGIRRATFTNVAGQRPEKPVWFKQANNTQPGSETAVNTTNTGVVSDMPVLQNALAQNTVTETFRDGATRLMVYEVKKEVFDPATPLTLWTRGDVTDIWPNGADRFINVSATKGPLGPVPTVAATMPAGGALVNKSTIDSTWTHMGGVCPDGVLEIADRVIDPDLMIDGGTTATQRFATNIKNGGIQLEVSASTTLTTTSFVDLPVRQPGGAAMTVALWAINASSNGWSDASVLTTASSGTGPTTVTVPAQAWATNDWVTVRKTDGTYADFQLTKISTTSFTLVSSTGAATLYNGARIVKHAEQYGIYTGYIDATLGANAVDTGQGYRRQLSYVGIDTATNKFLGCRLVPTPSTTPGNILPDGKIIRIVAGVAETFHPHGMPTSDHCSIATPALTGADFTVTRVDDHHFLIQGQTAINWNTTGTGVYGTYTPTTAHAYPLSGGEVSITLTSPTSGDTVAVNLGDPQISTVTKHKALAVQGYMKQGNTGLLSAFNNGKALLGAVLTGGQACHLTGNNAGFQQIDQDPTSAASDYTYTYPGSGNNRSLYLNSTANLKGALKQSFDAVEASGAATDRTLLAFGCEIWKNGQASSTAVFPQPTHFQDHINAIFDAVLQGAANNGGVKYWTRISLWNEMKGRAAYGLSAGWESDASLDPDLLLSNGTLTNANYLSNFAAAYTAFYNMLWDQVKSHSNSIINTLEVGGPHFAFGGVHGSSGFTGFTPGGDVFHSYPLGSPDGTVSPWSPDYDPFVYWMKWSHSFDFISIDYSFVDNNDTPNGTTTYLLSHQNRMGDLISRVKTLRNTYPLLSKASGSISAATNLATKRAAPVDMIEYYFDVNLARCDTNYAEDTQAMLEGVVTMQLYKAGIRMAYKWMPEGENTAGSASGPLRNKASWFRSEYGAVCTINTSSGQITGGGTGTSGDKYLAYDVVKLFVDNFPVGTQLYSTTITDPDLVAMASSTKILVINTNTTSSKSVIIGGSPHTLAAKAAAVYTTPASGPSVTLDDTQNINMAQPTNNAQVWFADNQRVRLVRCKIADATILALGEGSTIEMWDCDIPVSDVPGKFPYDQPAHLGVAGTYDPANQHVYQRMMYNNNILSTAGGAKFVMEGCVSFGVHGDFCQGTFDPASYARNCHIEHCMDVGGPTSGASNSRDGIAWSTGSTVMPKVNAGVHGDIQQWYDQYCYLVYACSIITHAHSLWFSRLENNYDYWLGATGSPTGTATVSSVGGLAQVTTSTNHSMNTGDTCRVRVGPGGIVGSWIGKKISNTVVALTTDGSSGVPYAGVTTNVDFIHTIRVTIPGIYRSVWLTSHFANPSDKTRTGPVNTDGNVSMSVDVTGLSAGHPVSVAINDLVANELTLNAVIKDNIVQTTGGAIGDWIMATPLTPSDYDITGNAAYNFSGSGGSLIPGANISPSFD